MRVGQNAFERGDFAHGACVEVDAGVLAPLGRVRVAESGRESEAEEARLDMGRVRAVTGK